MVILDDCAMAVARFNANSDRANLNCNRNPSNTNGGLGIACPLRDYNMKAHKKVYKKLCSSGNVYSAYLKARKGKSKKLSIIEFDKNLVENLKQLQKDLIEMTYRPKPHKKFIVRDPKTRTIQFTKNIIKKQNYLSLFLARIFTIAHFHA